MVKIHKNTPTLPLVLSQNLVKVLFRVVMYCNITVAGRIECQISFHAPVFVRFSGDVAYEPTGNDIYTVLLYFCMSCQ